MDEERELNKGDNEDIEVDDEQSNENATKGKKAILSVNNYRFSRRVVSRQNCKLATLHQTSTSKKAHHIVKLFVKLIIYVKILDGWQTLN